MPISDSIPAWQSCRARARKQSCRRRRRYDEGHRLRRVHPHRRGGQNSVIDAIADSRSPPWSADQTERMTGRVRVDVVAVWKRSCADLEDLEFRLVEVVDHHVEMELLGSLRIGPVRRLMVWSQLEGETRRRVILRDDDPVVRPVRHWQAEELR